VKHNFLPNHRFGVNLKITSAHQKGKVTHWLLLAVALAGLALKYNEVDDRLTADDIPVLKRVLDDHALTPREAPPDESWPEQRARIARTVQQVMRAAPSRKGIPEGLTREPSDVFRNGGGVCYDLSRLIEKALQMHGFRIRHVALYQKPAGKNLMQTLLTRRVISHAVSEVLTSRGWMVVDSVDDWLALDGQQNPLSIEQLSINASLHRSLNWSGQASKFYEQPFFHVYGLYARHGMFYPPFNPVPDVNYGQLLDNLR
jgi:hypothetical protein